MGLGGYLTWTAAMREIAENKLDDETKIVPCEMHGNTVTKIVQSPVFENNPYVYSQQKDHGKKVFLLPMNLPETNYCKKDTPQKAYHRYDKHMIEQICEYYGVEKPSLKCELYFSEKEVEASLKIISSLPKRYIVIEPHSKDNYTPNRSYPFEKWQNVVDSLKGEIDFVQIGRPGFKVLDGVVSLLGKTTFRESALVIKHSEMFVSTEGGLVHVANAVEKKSLIVLTGYQAPTMVAYPENINLSISSHGPCGLKVRCSECLSDSENHDYMEIVDKIRQNLR